MKELLLILLLIISNLSFSQDSKKDLIQKAETHLQKAKKLKEIDKNEALKNIDLALPIAKKYNSTKLLSDLYYTKSKILDYYKEFSKALKFYKLSAKIYIKQNDSLNTAKCFNNIGVTYYYYGNFDSAFVAYNKALIFIKNQKEYALHSKIQNNLGLINKARGNYKEAINNFHKCIKLNELSSDNSKISNSYHNIGVLYWEQENFNEALICFNTASDILENDSITLGLGDIYTNTGLIYKAMDKPENAMQFYDKAEAIYLQTENKQGLATVLLNKGVLVDEKGLRTEAEDLFSRSLELFKSINYATGIFINKIILSKIYSEKNENKKALKFATEALSLDSIDKPIKYILDGYFILAKTYNTTNNYHLANIYLNKYIELKDSLFTLEKNKQINELHTKFETEKKENRIALLEKDSKIQTLELETKSKYIKTISIFLGVILLFSVFSVILYLQKRKSYLILVEQNVRLAEIDIRKEEIRKIKYSETSLTQKQKQDYFESIIELMENKKYFLNSQFTINDFAKELNTNRNYLSQIINEKFNTNFNNFVNNYRIKEARKLLINPEYENYSIEGIAHTVGFNSKGSFNTAFKKFTGVTPSFFKNNSQNG